MRFIQYFFFCVLFTLTACGGGSGGGSTSSSSTSSSNVPPASMPPPVETGTIEVNQSAVNFSASQFGALPGQQALTIEFDAPRVTAGTLPGEGLPSWLDVSLTQTGDNVGRLVFSILDSNLDPGTFVTTIRLVSSNEAETSILDTVDIPVNYTVEPITLLETNVPLIQVMVAPLDAPRTSTITLLGEGVSWSSSSSDRDIVSLSPSSGVVPAGGQEVTITVTPNRNLFRGLGNSVVSFFQEDVPLNRTDLEIEIIATDGVFTDPENIAFMANVGSVEVQSQTLSLDSFDSSGASLINWTASSNQPWLTASPLSGAIDTGAASADLSNVTVNADPTGLSVGVFPGAITFTNDISDQVYNLPVTLIVGERNVATNRRGVALSNLATLEQMISVTDGSGVDVPWQAESQASWLTVTPSGVAGEPLTLTANPAGLAESSLSETTIIVTSPLSDITNEVVIPVGLWNGIAPTEAVSVNIGEDGFGAPDILLADPVRPYVYALLFDGFDTGTNITASLSTYNVYTGELVSGPVAIDAPSRSEIVISDDGEFVYLFPDSFNGADAQIERFTLPDLTPSDLIDIPTNFPFGRVEYTRVNSLPYIVSGRGGVFDVEAGTVLSDLNVENGFDLVVSANGVACTQIDLGGVSSRLDCYDLLGTGVAGMDIVTNRRNQLPIATNTSISAISPDGSTVYTNQGSSFAALATDDSQTELFRIEPAERLFLSETGLVGATTSDPEFLQVNVSTFDMNGELIGTTNSDSGFDPIATFSGDEGRIILLDSFDARNLTFVDAPSGEP